MINGRTLKQAVTAGTLPFSSHTPAEKGYACPHPYHPLGPVPLTPVPGSEANSMTAASHPSLKPSSARAAAVSTFTLGGVEELDVEKGSAAPMEQARPSQIVNTAEDEEDTVAAAASVQPEPTAAADAAAGAVPAAAAIPTPKPVAKAPADEEEPQQPEQQSPPQQQQPRGGGSEGVPDDDSGATLEAALEAAAADAEDDVPLAGRPGLSPPALGKPRGGRRKRKRAAREQQQYAKLKYTPGERHGAWEGQTVDGDVHDVYRGGFKAKEQQRCLNQPNKWVTLMPGDAREPADSAGVAADEGFLPAADHATPRGRAGSSVRGVPAVAHQQGRKHSCVFSSAASALVFVGETKAALAVAARIPKSLAHDNPMTLLHDVVKSKQVKTMEVVQVFKRGRLDLLSGDPSPYPTTVQLLGEDGGVGHAVTIARGWIFDATLPRALPLSRASLDACCSSAQGRVAYVCVARAVRYRLVAAPGVPSL